ncbi:transposase [Limnoglobus roseus]|uniref:Tc1-like transposase DDE domain-containing protein n=1 Tax=Limnoglobus roseus TaxID=2598579 RepID=A0A5C1ABW4_9BACT|nr:transposase [Limnoglobus roseus]QEL16859.1 hypothetical protein PX52LOC_03833 [Limnoglobus roseus]
MTDIPAGEHDDLVRWHPGSRNQQDGPRPAAEGRGALIDTGGGESRPTWRSFIDNAPWHRGQAIDAALADHPHLAFYRLPSYSPQLNPVERFWRVLRRRATHNRLFETASDLKGSIRNSLCYFQTVRRRMTSLVNDCFPAQNATASPTS